MTLIPTEDQKKLFPLIDEQKKEIERLKQENQDLKDALQEILLTIENKSKPKPKAKAKKQVRQNTTGIPDTFILTGAQLQKWYDKGKPPKGFEKFDKFDYNCCDPQSGEMDFEKGSAYDYKICLSLNDHEEVWVGYGGYYNNICGHQFNYDITFNWYNK